MKNIHLILASVATVTGLDCIGSSMALDPSIQSNTQDQQTVTSTTSVYTTTPMSAPLSATPTIGEEQTVTGKNIYKAITIQPGTQKITLDGLKKRTKVHLTLVNPSDTPLQFETVNRRGKQVVAMIPAHTQEVGSVTSIHP